MILKKVYFPILFLLTLTVALFVWLNLNKSQKEIENPTYYIIIDKAKNYYDNQKYDSAFYYYNKAKLVCNSIEKNRKSYAQYYMAVIQQMNCDFAGSEETATEIIKNNPHYPNILSIYNLLGLSYQEQSDYNEAIKYFRQSLKMTEKELDKCIIKNNIGYLFLESQNYQKAVDILNPLLSNDSLVADKTNYAKVLDNLGFAYFKLNNPEAINYLNKSLKIRDNIKEDLESIASFMHLAEYYQYSNPVLSQQFANNAYLSASKVNSPNDKIEALKFQISVSNPKESKQLALKQIALSDSINNVRQSAKNQFSKIKYDSRKAVQESEKQKNQKLIYLLLLVLLAITTVLSYFLIRAKNKQKVLKTTYNTETRISKKLHDELANDVYNAMMFAETQDLVNPENKENLLQSLDKIYLRTRNIAKENSDIDTGEKFQSNLLSMIASYRTENTNIINQNTTAINWTTVKNENKIAVFRVLQELLVNMKKHSQSTLVIIGFDTKKDTHEIAYSDNGIGTSEHLKPKNGLQNAENRIKDIKGSITFETATNKGFKARIIIPK